VAEVLSGLAIHPLEPGETPMEAFVLIKLLDARAAEAIKGHGGSLNVQTR